MTLPRVRLRHAQRRDRSAAQQGRRIQMVTHDEAREPVRRARAQIAGALRHDHDVRLCHVHRGEQPRVHSDRLEVAPVGLPDRHRRVEPPGLLEARDRLRERQRQCRAIGHDVGDAGLGPLRPHPRDDRRQRRVEVRDDDRRPVDARGLREGRVMRRLLVIDPQDHRLQRRVPVLHEMSRTRSGVRRQAIGYRGHEREAARAQAPGQGGHVQQHSIAGLRRAHQIGVRERADDQRTVPRCAVGAGERGVELGLHLPGPGAVGED